MRRTGIAIHAAMLTSEKGVYRLVEGNVRRFVAADDGPNVLKRNLSMSRNSLTVGERAVDVVAVQLPPKRIES